MIKFFINIAYTPDPDKLSGKINERGSQSIFLSFCMHAAGVHRIFDKAGAQEFLYRLAIIFRHYEIVSRFFTDDTLISYTDRGVKNILCLNDIIENLGIELSDYHNDCVEREQWADKIDTYWKNACMIGVFTGKAILDSRVIGLNKFLIGSNVPMPLTAEYEKTANLFASEAIKTIGEPAFKELEERIIERKKQLQKQKADFAVKPKHTFNYEKIPWKVVTRIYIKVFGSIKDKKVVFEEIKQPESTLAALIHLAWLWVNGYVTVYRVCMNGKYSYTAEVDGRMDFDYNKYDGLNRLGFGINIYDTYYDYRLDKIEHLLKEKD